MIIFSRDSRVWKCFSFTANKVCITSDSISTFSKTNTANQGAAFELTDSLSSLVISDKATVEVNQTGRLALVNSNTDSSFSLGKEAILHLTNRQGLTGNGNSYFDSVIVGAGSQLEINNVENGFSSIRRGAHLLSKIVRNKSLHSLTEEEETQPAQHLFKWTSKMRR